MYFTFVNLRPFESFHLASALHQWRIVVSLFHSTAPFPLSLVFPFPTSSLLVYYRYSRHHPLPSIIIASPFPPTPRLAKGRP